MSIKRIKIAGFKSIDNTDLNELDCFSIFAGANGAGKSNLFDAIRFASRVINDGAVAAIRAEGGFEHLHCFKRRREAARTFQFIIEVELEGSLWKYDLKVYQMDTEPLLSETLTQDKKKWIKRNKGELPQLANQEKDTKVPEFPQDRSSLLFSFQTPLFHWLSNIQVYRIDPLGAKEPDPSNTDDSGLDHRGHNVATMLASLEKDEVFRETILEWMELIAPGLQKVNIEQQRLDGRTLLKFQEQGSKTPFPANLVSDGTIYVLCILTAILSRGKKFGLTLIEEPERGINPKVVGQIVKLMRDKATNKHPIWVTTHNETLVRESKPRELVLAGKMEGKTEFTLARESEDSVGDMPLDKAWLSNIFGRGLPW